jgi:hypothetical protein
MNQYELAVLRVLLKSPGPLNKSKVVNGFPDDSLDFVLSAISDLKQENYIVARGEGSGNETLELVKERKKDVLALLNPDASQNDPATGKSSSGNKGKGAVWITATLVIVGALASMYVAYAAGVNDRLVASQQLVKYPAQDVTFKIVHLSDGKVGVFSDPTFQAQLPSQGRVISKLIPSDVFIEYKAAGAVPPEVTPFTLGVAPNN